MKLKVYVKGLPPLFVTADKAMVARIAREVDAGNFSGWEYIQGDI